MQTTLKDQTKYKTHIQAQPEIIINLLGLKNQLQITSVARNYLQGHVHQSGAEESVSMRHQHLLFSYNIHELL